MPFSLRPPRSLRHRLLLTMAVGVLAVQLIGNLIWAVQLQHQARQELTEAATQIAGSAAEAIRFFRALPPNYRPILLEQLREMGGTRFFVTVNQHPVTLRPIQHEPLLDLVTETVTHTIQRQSPERLQVAFAWPERLPVSDEGATVEDLPENWVAHTLLLQPRPAPVLVIQTEIESGDWLYLASVMPDPYFLDSHNPFPPDRLLLQVLTLVVVLLLSAWVVRWLTQPLAQLAAHADAFGKGVGMGPLPENSSQEFLKTAAVFREMQERIQRFLDDRERLFASISHDLRTPITRLKLRTELLDDETLKADYHEDLDELDMMVKGALQSVKDTDIHENQTTVRLDTLLERMAHVARLAGHEVTLDLAPTTLIARPLAIKRAIGNLLDNALRYGDQVEISLCRQADLFHLQLRDHGPGIPEAQLNQLFSPYTRLPHGKARNQQGMGLGLSIAKNIIHAHGGKLVLRNHPAGGLIAHIELPVPTDHTLTAASQGGA
ncbi:signal transduction histidine kinase [Chitinivorax tropicus]|uniref:histidine kinase n=1 Tax=Chitinivorax tropicus TaxID=714531 RepID=A0A840MTU8_9PROT|nr:ATP-binding protein [Chitinivorax tropicus]MBB5018621.1 signal transduction histidine kinase [Chitinivorax tropicus]